jgi:uncharacterized protein (TIGR00251 family)
MTRVELDSAGVIVTDKTGALLLAVHVQPGAKSTETVGIHGDRLKVRLAAPPVDGKANKALIEWAQKFFQVSKRDVELVRGQSSRQKTLRITL